MMHAGLDLSRKRLDVELVDDHGTRLAHLGVMPDRDGLRSLARQVAHFGHPVQAAIESMNGARFIHDELELAGWEVAIADAVKVKGLAPLACKTDRIDAWVLAELSRRDLVPEIWLPDPGTRAERERARWRLHLVHHRTMLKNRIHQTLISFGHPCPVADLFGSRGRELLASLELPEPWLGTVTASLQLIDDLDRGIDRCAQELRGLGADHRYVPLLLTVPGISWVPRLHDRLRDRRYCPLRILDQTGGVHRPVSHRPAVGRARSARSTGEERPEIFALGADRDGIGGGPTAALSRSISADQASPWPTAWWQGGAGGPGSASG